MNCQDLEIVAGDLARGQMMDANLRERALSHAASCASCASQLADEQALTAGLRCVAAGGREAPASVEASLLVAFRAHHLASASPALSSARVASRRWLYIAASVAAVAVLVMLLSLASSRKAQPAPQKAGGSSTGKEVTPAPRPTPRIPDSVGSPDKKVAVGRPRDSGRDTIKSPRQPKRGTNNLTRASSEPEIATDFFPLVNRESLTQLDGGQLVRVELPRSALMSFGLPMNIERANERIKADVVVGNDGLARAIRFVR